MHHRFGGYPMDFMGAFSIWNLLLIGIVGLVILALVIVGVILLLRKDQKNRQSFSTNRSLEILQERFAKGEIDEQEYRSRKAVIVEELNNR